MYALRTDTGIKVGEVSNFEAGKMMMQNCGRWEQKEFVRSGKQNVFVFSENFSYGNRHIKLAVWEGFYLQAN
jgi:hypothetical protein